MNKFNELKSIIKRDSSEEASNKFIAILNQGQGGASDSGLKQQEVDLLLRWAVLEQKKKFSIYYNHLKIIGANVNFIDKGQKKSNLILACEGTSIEIVETLVNDKDVNVKYEDSSKKNCLFYAIQNKNKEKGEKFIRMIIQKCPEILSPEKNSKRNKTPLIAAIEKSRLQIVKTMLDLGADPNQKINDNGNTPIYQAIKLMKLHFTQVLKQIVQHLLDKGGDPYIRNKQGKNAMDVAEKFQADILQMIEESNKKKVTPDLSINSITEREEMFEQASKIFSDLEYMIEISQNSSEQSEAQDNQPFEDTHLFMNTLSDEIIQFAQECENNHENAKKDLQKFLQIFTPISEKLNLRIEIYGSFATKLWLKHCDIDLLLMPEGMLIYDDVEGYLDQIYFMLMQVAQTSKKFSASMLKTIKVPMIRVQMTEKELPYWERKRSPRKFDITIMDKNHNGKQHVIYITQLMHCYPYLQPLFYVIKKLSYTFKLNDPKQNGVRSYAIILMIAYFLQQYQVDPNHRVCLGQLLLGFLRKYGYIHEYQFIQTPDVNKSLMLNLADPINIKNNVGNHTDAYSLQKMFRTAYIILHTKGCDNKLAYMFDARNMFGPLNY